MHYIFISTQRSGHHAILIWFAAQHKKDFSHYNNCKINAIDQSVNSSNGKPCNCCNGNRTIKNHEQCKNIIFSFESKPLHYIETSETLSPICNHHKIKKILVLRDHYNFVASYLTKWNTDRIKKLEILNRWKEYANKILEIQQGTCNEYDYILYNQWCVDGKYRRVICEKYNLTYTDICFKDIPTHGNGSSFRNLETKKDKRDYNNRYKVLLESCDKKLVEEYRELVTDHELVQLTDKIFGMKVAV